ncbi:MAG: hypothetical protein ACYCYA_14885, partial [Actinomycetes bacterium]
VGGGSLGGNDPAGCADILRLLASLAPETTVLLSSHDLAEVEAICEAVGILADGRLLCQGLLADLLASAARSRWRVVIRPPAARTLAALGVLGSWYETSAPIGPLSPGVLGVGFGFETLGICSCTSAVAARASIARSVSAISGVSLASLLALVLLSGIPVLSSWSPSALGASVADLVGVHHPGVPWHALTITAAVTVILLAASTLRLAAPE